MNSMFDKQSRNDRVSQPDRQVTSHLREARAMNALAVEATQAARLCGVSRATWYSLRKAGRVPKPIRLGRRVLWRIEELREWMAAGCPPMSRWEAVKNGRWG